MTRKEQRSEMVNAIKRSADFGHSSQISCCVDLIEYELEKENIDKDAIRKQLDATKKANVIVASQMMRNYHAFNMACEYALLIGEQHDPML